MTIDNNQVVSLTYELRKNNEEGDVIQKVDPNQPFAFLTGSGNVISGFEDNLKGKTEGDQFSFNIPQDQAYGPLREDAVVELSREIFALEDKQKEAEMLQEGNVIPMRDQQGNPLQGRVLNVGDENVKMDFNHPLAGMDLHFHGTILNVREASPEEIEHGHVHGEGGVQH